MEIILEIIVTIMGISFLAEFLNYRIKKSFDEENDMYSYTPEEFVRFFCYVIITGIYITYAMVFGLIHI